MIGKPVYFLFVLLSIAAVVNAAPTEEDKSLDGVIHAERADTGSHHLIVGSRTPYDKLVVRQQVTKASSVLQIVKVTQTFYALNEKSRITQVRALDQKTNGNGATASLLSGGPGANQVTLQFKSKRGHGINFIVELYAE